MKKIITMIVALVATVSTFAQQEVGTLSVAPKVGVNFASLSNSKGDTKVALVAGAELAYQMSEKFAISGGLFYSQQGTKKSEGGATVKMNLDYFNVPILANYYVAPGLAIKAGIQPGALLSAKNKYEQSGNDADFDIKDGCTSIDFSIPVGLSYEVSNFVIDARYNIGLTNLQKDLDGDKGMKNNVIMLTVGYKFGL